MKVTVGINLMLSVNRSPLLGAFIFHIVTAFEQVRLLLEQLSRASLKLVIHYTLPVMTYFASRCSKNNKMRKVKVKVLVVNRVIIILLRTKASQNRLVKIQILTPTVERIG